MQVDQERSEPLAANQLPPPLPIGPETAEWYGNNRVSNDLKKQWIEQGYSVLRGAYPVDKIKTYNDIVVKVRRDFDTGEDEFGYGDRIGQLHQRHPELLELAATPEILEFLRWALNDEPVVFGSLNFERGTEQEAHIDAIFFWPEPSYSMAGCWVALEDISVDSGPLFYVPHSHKWPFYLSEHVAEHEPELAQRRRQLLAEGASNEEMQRFAGEMGHAWTRQFLALEKKMCSERQPLSLKAGDVVFWHSLLAHGGSPRANRAMTRKSAVFHFIGRNTKLYTFEQFMLHDRKDLANQLPQPMNLGNYKGLIEFMRYGHFVTHTPHPVINPL